MGTLRITSGRLRGRAVTAPDGEGTRPLLTRVRKSLVDILRPELPGARVLDLFAGSGAIAFEMISNGAEHAVVIDRDADAASRIRENARNLGLDGVVEVLCRDALGAVPELAAQAVSFDLVVVAPPYGFGLQARALELVAAHGLLAPAGTAVVQRERGEEQVPVPTGLRLHRSRGYGRTVFDFYRVSETPSVWGDDDRGIFEVQDEEKTENT